MKLKMVVRSEDLPEAWENRKAQPPLYLLMMLVRIWFHIISTESGQQLSSTIDGVYSTFRQMGLEFEKGADGGPMRRGEMVRRVSAIIAEGIRRYAQ